MSVTLLVMAAGLGSRFGGLKQIEPVGPHGKIIMDYSVFDAKRAGFGKVVFVIKPELERDFRAVVGRRIEKLIDVDYAFQTIDDDRAKPWGTGHAVLCAADAVATPFCVINADDFYGAGAFAAMGEHLQTSGDYAMVGFPLENTLTDNGTVARGICEVAGGYLRGVTEHTSIAADNDFPKGTVVSMNMWGFTTSIFGYLEEHFAQFREAKTGDPKAEFFLPSVVDNLIKSGRERVRVLPTTEKWYGVTYREDLDGVRGAIKKMTEAGKYEFE
ncbi:nucleotidyltransferase [Clostridia bacterium]|nr:nucleotidyltransferase [Clostridia bacterium]